MLKYFIIWFSYFIVLMLISLLFTNIISYFKRGYNHDNSISRLAICIIISIIGTTSIAMFNVMILEKQDSAKTFVTMSKEELSKVSEDTLLEYEYYIKNADPNYKEKEKVALKLKVDNFLKENNISLSEKEYEEVLKTKQLSYNNEIIKFNISIKDALSTEIKEK
jgi:hypothetical protein